MAPGEYRELDRLVAGLAAELKAFQKHWETQDHHATEGRKVIFDKIEDLSHDFQAVSYDVRDLKKDVGQMKPTVDRLDNLRVEATGIAKVGKIGWMVIGALGSGVLWTIDHWALLEHLTH